MLRPTTLQLLVPHIPGMDYVIWPQIRDNMIKYAHTFNDEEVAGLLFCTWRIRSTPNVEPIQFDEQGQLQIDPDFLARISTVDGWLLLGRFWEQYPNLTEGLDPAKHRISEADLV
jgi:hypothetical protein